MAAAIDRALAQDITGAASAIRTDGAAEVARIITGLIAAKA